jgi:hypothetical protein
VTGNGNAIEIVVSVVILVGMVWIVFRTGARNPVPTGDLSKQLRHLGGRVERVEESIKSTASKAEVALLAGEVEALKQHTATSGDILALEGKINALRAELIGIGKAADRTEQGVQTIQNILMKKALDG